jgi:predicted RNA-binding protein with PUA-like domain
MRPEPLLHDQKDWKMVSRQKAASKKGQTSKRRRPSGFWMVKQEPESYSWRDLVRDGRTDWTGVRNFQARNNLRLMKRGDRVLFYHSGKEKSVVGIAAVAKEGYPDPTSDDRQWVAVDVEPVKALNQPVPLASIRYHPALGDLPLIRQSQLSVMPLTREEFQAIIGMARKRGKK